MRRTFCWSSAAFAAALLAGGARPAAAQAVDTAFQGSVLPRLTARVDSAFHYAAFIPKRYHGTAPAPLLLVLDPAGRAVPAIVRFAPAAERLGWIVLSSYDTRSDDPKAPNERAVNVMLADAFGAFSIDTSRIYLAGFSGTARDTWGFAYGSSGHVAGIVSAGAAMPTDTIWRRLFPGPPPFDVALSSGARGINQEEVVSTAAALRAARRASPTHAALRVDVFPGTHQWPPEPVLARQLGWLDVRAMARRLRPIDQPLADSVFARDSADAVALVAAHRLGDAADRWAEIAAAWAGAHDVTFAAARAAQLDTDPAVRPWRAERDSLMRATPDYQRGIIKPLSDLRQRPGVPDLRRLTQQLNIVALQQWAADANDSLRADWAARRLSDVYAQVSLYEPEAYLAYNDADRALALLAVAEEIQGSTPRICRERARAYAVRHDADLTITELKCALAGHLIDLQEIRTDPRYQFMRSLDAFNELIDPTPGH
ncbi:MAG: hypothetical protein ACYCVL_01615 [Gemmatimonadaceae bacterium]